MAVSRGAHVRLALIALARFLLVGQVLSTRQDLLPDIAEELALLHCAPCSDQAKSVVEAGQKTDL